MFKTNQIHLFMSVLCTICGENQDLPAREDFGFVLGSNVGLTEVCTTTWYRSFFWRRRKISMVSYICVRRCSKRYYSEYPREWRRWVYHMHSKKYDDVNYDVTTTWKGLFSSAVLRPFSTSSWHHYDAVAIIFAHFSWQFTREKCPQKSDVYMQCRGKFLLSSVQKVRRRYFSDQLIHYLILSSVLYDYKFSKPKWSILSQVF